MRARGTDGKVYRVIQTRRGVKRWSKVAGQG